MSNRSISDIDRDINRKKALAHYHRRSGDMLGQCKFDVLMKDVCALRAQKRALKRINQINNFLIHNPEYVDRFGGEVDE